MRRSDDKRWRFMYGSCSMSVLGGATLLLLQLGCSGSNPYDLVNVSGKVTYEDGSLIPAKSIMLKFNPEVAAIDTKTHPRKGFALVNVSDGTFEYATTHTHADGLVAGKHKVLIVAYGEEGKSAKVVPPEYLRPDTTPVEIDTENASLEIKVKKPKGA
ncbi:hypothetical protein [Lacipirellula parvula]|uniref:Uncharacterized protein n=1 Tax=Lacipirellula parvula TaxID=2650471 RepID=A0A5K7XF52_9BACT|nr:hypothetical protein [Lacipirellula parvula]BBO34677.1 hypothetical protein PLANPX_4289 [Lacipirellula parvula]